MISNFLNNLLKQNIDQISAEAGAPVPELPEIRGESNGGGRVPEAPQEKAAEKSQYPDKEQLLGTLGERVEDFFSSAKSRGPEIIDTSDEIKRSSLYLQNVAENGKQLKHTLQDTPDSRTNDLSSSANQIANRAQESAEDIHRTIRSIDVGRQLYYIDAQGKEFTGPGLEKYKEEINEALQIENAEERSQKLDELKSRLTTSLIRIDQDANNSSNKALSLREDTENNTRVIHNRVDDIQDSLPRLQEKMGDAYYRAARQIQEIADLNSDARNKLRRLDELPIELRLLSNTANDLGLDVTKIFEALKKGEYN